MIVCVAILNSWTLSCCTCQTQQQQGAPTCGFPSCSASRCRSLASSNAACAPCPPLLSTPQCCSWLPAQHPQHRLPPQLQGDCCLILEAASMRVHCCDLNIPFCPYWPARVPPNPRQAAGRAALDSLPGRVQSPPALPWAPAGPVTRLSAISGRTSTGCTMAVIAVSNCCCTKERERGSNLMPTNSRKYFPANSRTSAG